MLWYVLRWLYSVSNWLEAIPSSNVFRAIDGSNMINNVLHWEFSNYPRVNLVCAVFNSAMICVVRIAVSVGTVIASGVVEGKCNPAYEDGFVEAIIIHCDGIQPCQYYFNWTEGLWQ